MPRRVRTPIVMQMEAAECGAACLGIVLGYFGRFESLPELRRACGVSRDGSKASKVLEAARHYGLEAKGWTKDLATLRRERPPFIVFWQFQHFLVVEGFSPRGVYVNDPAAGRRRLSWNEFSAGYTGVVLLARPGENFRRGGRPPSLARAIARRLWPARGALAFGVAAGALLAAPTLLLSAGASVLLDSVLAAGRWEQWQPLVWLLAGGLAAHALLLALQVGCLRRLHVALDAALAARFVRHALNLPYAFFANRFPGEVGYRLRLNDRAAHILAQQVAATLIALATMAFYLPWMLLLSGPLTALTAGLAVASVLALRRAFASRAEASQRLSQAEGRLYAASVAGVQAIETLKAASQESTFFARWAGYHAEAVDARQQLERSVVPAGAWAALAEGLTVSLTLALGGWQVIAGTLSIGMLVAFQLVQRQFLSPVRELVELSGALHEFHADLLRLDDVLDTPAAPPAANSTSPAAPSSPTTEAAPRLTVRGLTFGYNPAGPPLVHDVDLELTPGKRVALVGRTGSGKSTLARLLVGLYEPWSGACEQTGPAAGAARGVGYVDQDVVLFEGTLRENLTHWDDRVADATILAACADAAAEEIVAALPAGLESRIDEGGANLSGGERQRLELARALVADPWLVVLDEATSALDTATELQVLDGLRRRGCAAVLVTHRLSAIRDADEIIVLDEGRIVERGPHEALLAAGGRYAELTQLEVQA